MLLFMKMKILKQRIVDGKVNMIELTRRSGVIIPRKYEKEIFYRKIRGNLFRRSKQYNTPDYIIQKFFIESDKYLIIPRFFPVQDYISCKINDIPYDGKTIDITHNITLRNETQKNAVNYMLQNQSGVIELQPGMGKTIISIYMIAERKKKSLILVHRDSLVSQWKNRFLEFTSLNNEDITRLSSTKFKEELQKSVIITTNQMFISLLKRKRTDFLMMLNKANIGVFVADEVHTSIGAPIFSECSIHIPSKVVFGLSATPYRWDGNTDIIQYHLGDIYKDEDTSDTLPSKITVLMFDFGIDIPKRYKYLHWEGTFQRSRYLNLMRKSKILVNVSKSLLDNLKSRDVFFISERLNLIDLLFKQIGDVSKSKFIAGSSDESLKSKITFSTPGKCRDGIDAQWKDVCIMTSPIKNIHQMIGRINRTYLNKRMSTVIDMVDIGCSNMSNTYYGRLEYYKLKNWDIQYVVIDQRFNMHVIDEKTALDIIRR